MYFDKIIAITTPIIFATLSSAQAYATTHPYSRCLLDLKHTA
jgi:hypothetical protein